MSQRPTIDIVVIVLSITVGSTLMLCVIGLLLLRFLRPEVDTVRGGEQIGTILTTITGALVGLIGGRAQGRLEANGGK